MLGQVDGIAIAGDLGEPYHIRGFDSLGVALRHPDAQVLEGQGLQRRKAHGAVRRRGGAGLLGLRLVRYSFLIEPLGDDASDLAITVVVPLLLGALTADEALEAPKRAAALNGVQQGVALFALGEAEAEVLHDGVFVNVELRGQSEPVGRVHDLADLDRRVALPVRQVRVVGILERPPVLIRHRVDLAGAPVQIGRELGREDADFVGDRLEGNLDRRHDAARPLHVASVLRSIAIR
jgi:hypothetical protein